MNDPRVRHLGWSRIRYLAFPMLVSWVTTPIAFNSAAASSSPWWIAYAVLAVTLALTGVYLRGAVINYRHVSRVLGRGHCVACDYDLRGTIVGGGWECAECGRAVSSAMADRVRRTWGDRGIGDSDGSPGS